MRKLIAAALALAAFAGAQRAEALDKNVWYVSARIVPTQSFWDSEFENSTNIAWIDMMSGDWFGTANNCLFKSYGPTETTDFNTIQIESTYQDNNGVWHTYDIYLTVPGDGFSTWYEWKLNIPTPPTAVTCPVLAHGG